MGDDDSFDPSAFDQIKRIIAADPSLGLIYMNYEGWSPDLSQRTTPPIIKATQDQRFAQGLDLLALVAGQISYLSSVCVRRDLFISGLQDMDDRDKSSSVDQVWPLLYVLKHAPAHFVAQPLVKCRTRWITFSAFWTSFRPRRFLIFPRINVTPSKCPFYMGRYSAKFKSIAWACSAQIKNFFSACAQIVGNGIPRALTFGFESGPCWCCPKFSSD
jgi:hypothetical protein